MTMHTGERGAHRRQLLLAGGLLATGLARAQAPAARPIKLVVPFAAGGSSDAIARLVGQKLGEGLGQPVVVENRPGAAGAIASEQVAKATGDGLTLLLATTSTHSILPVANPRLAYDAIADFAPVGMVARAPNVLVASPRSGAATVKDLVQLGKSKPGALSFASSGNGTITHLVAEAFNASAGIKAVHVPYKTGVQALADVVSGQIDYQFDSIVWTLPQVRAGKIRGLAVTGLRRSALAPDLPTVAESGLPGFEGVTWFALVAPASTPKDLVSRYNSELNKALQSADVQEKLAAQGAEPAPGTADDLARAMREDRARWGKVVRDAGVKFE